MPSTFGWLDTDSEQRRKMLDVVDLFRERGILDELGIGAVRDTFSDILFPGTSTQHQRLRYVLFVPWLMLQAAEKKAPDEMQRNFEDLEFRLIGSLKNGLKNSGEVEVGVIGSAAGRNLKLWPHSMYWGALGAWGIRRVDSIAGYFRQQHDYRALRKQTTSPDDAEARDSLTSPGLDPELPPAPPDLLEQTTFILRPEDEEYLSRTIAHAARDTVLGWMVLNPPAEDASFVWEIGELDQLPARLRSEVEHARRFSLGIEGASLMYSFLVNEKANREEQRELFRTHLSDWQQESASFRALEEWDSSDFWALIRGRNPRLSRRTEEFVEGWIRLSRGAVNLAESRDARDLIAVRERQIKGGRGPLVNQSMLDSWSTGTRRWRHSFRWEIAKMHVGDLAAARNPPAAGSGT